MGIAKRESTGHNVIGYLPPTGGAAFDKPYVMLGAHYDHLGYGRGGDSLARGDEAGRIHNGADDNASGVAAVLAAGARLARTERGRGSWPCRASSPAARSPRPACARAT